MKKEELDKIIAGVNSAHKNEMFTQLNALASNISRTSSGRLSIDIPIGGGVPDGRIIELYGQESSGKTTIALHIMASYQETHPDRAVAFLDYEHAFDKVYAESLGVDCDQMVFAQPEYAEQGLEGVDALISTGKFSLIVVDSVSAMVPKSELEGDMDSSSIGVQARLMSKAMRKIVGKANKNNTTVIFINQLREKIGVMFGNPWTTTGGNALKFYSSIRIEVQKNKVIKEDGMATGVKGKIKVVKNKTAPPFQESEYDIAFGVGISKESEIYEYGVTLGLINKKGSWFSYGDTKIGQGKQSVLDLLADNPELMDELESKILEQVYSDAA